ncbi:hypothetical protein [Actinophytocola glycyrrhizae]|uniref:DUF1918 domain-containing protein n=1 Tax=Actinophytocola glycyrrhizae TaxID=2044873 RepID=A0ABV9RS15_9PSEU
MFTADGGLVPPAHVSGLPDGLHVLVTGGRYHGEHGEVVARAPDLRPGSAWVALSGSGTHLVPAYRLASCDSDDCHLRAD